MTLEKSKFPIGKYEVPSEITTEIFDKFISDIQNFPRKLRREVENFSDSQLDMPYRIGGWTTRQVIHHCADSHMNGFIRHKLALTEMKPIIKPYIQDRWAELVDSKQMPIEPSLLLLEGLHQRWTVLLRSLSKNELKLTFIHPEHGKEFILGEHVGLYAWHCNHHFAHIAELKKRQNWK